MADKVKETAKEEVNRVKDWTQDAVRSGAYIYPLRGVYFFITHRSLWGPLWKRLAPTLTLGIGIFSSMFFFTYLPQAAFMALFNGPVAALTTALLVLNESSTIFNIMAKTFLIDDALIDTFDGTLLARNKSTLVSQGREVKSGNDPMRKLGKLITKPFAKFSPQAIIRYLMYLPLNMIPLVGTVLFIAAQGRRAGPQVHDRYFQLKGMNAKQREEWVAKRQGAYSAFGIPAVLLELIPVAGIFFAFTNQVGGALWAADLEDREEGTSPNLRETAKKAT